MYKEVDIDKRQWKDVVGYEGLYEVSDTGEVRNKRTYKILKPTTQNSGYKFVCLSKGGNIKCYSLHRLVLEAFKPLDKNIKERMVVNHKDYDKTNNNLDNLEWMTQSENVLYGSGPNELKILESMLCNAIKKALHDWYNVLLTTKVTKECFTDKVVEEAIKGATEFFKMTHEE